MSAIGMLASQPWFEQVWVERLGATLLHFLWQGLAIAAIYAAARRLAGRTPASRYAIACGALAAMLGATVATWIATAPELAQPVAATFAAPLPPPGAARATLPILPYAVDFSPGLTRPFFSWVVGIWLAGAGAFWMRLLGGCLVAARLRSQSVRSAPSEWQQAFDRLKARVAVARPVRLLISPLVEAPAVIGWLRPLVLVPTCALAGLPAAHLEALLLHELAHVRRHDYLVNLAQTVVEALLFYHPAVWWISGHIHAERELCCDDITVSVTGDAATYARALLGIATAARVRPALSAAGGSLSHRVARLLGQSRAAGSVVSGPGALTACLALGAAGLAAFAQSPARRQFEAASVKPVESRGFQRVRPQPGRLTATATARLLIQNAYSLQPYQIAGAPAWAESEHFEIDAKAAGNTTRSDLFLMLQSLLEERFQLRVHRETRELPVFALVAAKSGLKLPPPKEGNCAKPVPAADLEWAGGRMQPPGSGPAPLPACGSIAVALDPSGAVLRGGSVQMPELVRILSMMMGRSVLDRTSFPSPFDVKLGFLPDQSTAALPPLPPESAAATNSPYPSIVTALQEQLGLRLESTRGPVEVVVIDRLERPSVN